MKRYYVKASYIAKNSVLLIFPTILSIIIFTSGDVLAKNEIIGLVLIWTMALLIVFAPTASSIEVGDGRAIFYLLGARVRSLSASNVEVIDYGPLMRWGGLGVGNGLKGWEVSDGRRRYFSVGEEVYGYPAIQHLMQELGAAKK